MNKKFCFFKLLIFSFIFSLLNLCYAQEGKVYNFVVIELGDTIQPVSAEFLIKTIEEINNKNTDFLIIIALNTPGGLLASTEDITSAILSSKIPISVYVSPTGGKAASAGFFILLSSDFPAMASATNTGAAHPVSLMPSFFTKEGKKVETKGNVGEEKALEYASAFIRSIAEKRGRPIEFAEKAVRESKAYTANESLELGLIDYIEKDYDLLASRIANDKLGINGKIVQRVVFRYSFREKLLSMLASPQIVYLLFLAGILGIFIEIKSPGTIFPGLFGALCLIMFFYATKTIPINFAGVLFIVLAVILFMLEFKVVSYGFLTIGGIVSMLIGSAMLIDSDLPGFAISTTELLFSAFLISVIFIFILRFIVKIQSQNPVSGLGSYIGKVGESITEISHSGKIFFNGEYWNAESTNTIEKGKKVIIIDKSDNMVLKVKEKGD